MYSQGFETTQESMYAAPRRGIKRKRSGAASSRTRTLAKRVSSVPRNIAGQSIIIPRIGDLQFNLATDVGRGFGFGLFDFMTNGVASGAIAGTAELTNLFDFIRIVKVEITMMPGQNVMDYTSTTSAIQGNIPYVYESPDFNDSTNPSINDMREMAATRCHSFSKPIRRTVYPRLETSTTVVNMGQAEKDQFVKSTASDRYWYGWKFYADMDFAVFTNGNFKISFKVFYECRNTK